MALSIGLFELLACPRCKGAVHDTVDGSGLVCPACRLKYPIWNDIPIMLIDEAEELGDPNS